MISLPRIWAAAEAGELSTVAATSSKTRGVTDLILASRIAMVSWGCMRDFLVTKMVILYAWKRFWVFLRFTVRGGGGEEEEENELDSRMNPTTFY